MRTMQQRQKKGRSAWGWSGRHTDDGVQVLHRLAERVVENGHEIGCMGDTASVTISARPVTPLHAHQ